MKKEKVKKLKMNKQWKSDRARLLGTTENFMTTSLSRSVIQQVLDTFADCRKCDSFTEFTYAFDSKYETLCTTCGHKDGFTTKIERNNVDGVTIQVTWVDKSDNNKVH
jgi:hypothetical protein